MFRPILIQVNQFFVISHLVIVLVLPTNHNFLLLADLDLLEDNDGQPLMVGLLLVLRGEGIRSTPIGYQTAIARTSNLNNREEQTVFDAWLRRSPVLGSFVNLVLDGVEARKSPLHDRCRIFGCYPVFISDEALDQSGTD